MRTFTIKVPLPNRNFWVAVTSVLVSVFLVATMVYGATTIDNTSIGVGTSTPGAAIGVKGEVIVEGFIHADYFLSTSTSHATGFGTSSPGAEFAVAGGALFEGGLTASFLSATSTATSTFSGVIDVNDGNSTSTFSGGLIVDTESLIVDFNSNQAAFGTTTFPGATADSVAPDLTINSPTATSTLFLTNESTGGSQIILKSTDGSGCIAISATRDVNDIGAVAMDALTLLNVDVIACPE